MLISRKYSGPELAKRLANRMNFVDEVGKKHDKMALFGQQNQGKVMIPRKMLGRYVLESIIDMVVEIVGLSEAEVIQILFK
ncbi:unnamed protein product [Rotaria sp. Silwood1]|nr:unnamed protein product [Rotaria sp. Silwood1]CAF5064961.1 unnamed protein product [Rotaria sp. Silwood1]